MIVQTISLPLIGLITSALAKYMSVSMDAFSSNVLFSDKEINKKIIKLDEINELACEDLLFLININSSVSNAAFAQVRNAKSTHFWKKTARLHGTGQ